jgi:hypothetical protein
MAEKRVRLVIERDERKPRRWKLLAVAVLVILLARWPVLVALVVALPALIWLRMVIHRSSLSSSWCCWASISPA